MGGVLVAVMIGVGPIVVAVMLLNRRERREAALWDALVACLAPLRGRDLRGEVAVGLWVGLWSGRARLTVDLGGCEAGRVWMVVDEVSSQLPAGVVLLVLARSAAPSPCPLPGGEREKRAGTCLEVRRLAVG